MAAKKAKKRRGKGKPIPKKRSSTSSRRGFAGMDPEKHRKIAAQGGKAAHEAGVAHQMTPEEASEAGRKGGRKLSRDRKHMAEIGRKGGEARKRKKGKKAA